MVVSDDHRRRIALQGQLDDFARMHARTVDGAAKQLFVLDQAVTLIEIQATEHFMFEVAQLRAEKIAGCTGTRQRRARSERLGELPPGDFDRGLQLREPRHPESGYGAKPPPIGGDEFSQAAKALEHVACKIEG